MLNSRGSRTFSDNNCTLELSWLAFVNESDEVESLLDIDTASVSPPYPFLNRGTEDFGLGFDGTSSVQSINSSSKSVLALAWARRYFRRDPTPVTTAKWGLSGEESDDPLPARSERAMRSLATITQRKLNIN